MIATALVTVDERSRRALLSTRAVTPTRIAPLVRSAGGRGLRSRLSPHVSRAGR